MLAYPLKSSAISSASPQYKPVRQKRHSYDAEQYEAMHTKVDKLKAIGFIREATYPVWLANSAMVYIHDPADSEHTTFITDKGLTMEVYVDDMLVKSRTAEEHVHNLALMFDILNDYRMRLNPTKCAFGVSSGKFLGFMSSQRGIEANPEKIKAIIDMEKPKTHKDIQSLTGHVAALTRFISKAVANFISELTPSAASEPVNTCTDTEELGRQSAERFDPSVLVWILHVDGLANQKDNGRLRSQRRSTTHQVLQKFKAYKIRQILRTENSHADALARLASAINDRVSRKV
ncbi:hypothetical protein L3X38_037340 [Prunus dulcis]|uniref:Reverse transcriptase domain-containing protein n=1 Tax=Prunus dulcis TaxID=3755 RepID=A0AAD4YR68_PRUDU|nr:hypothetical protein L3X38_037340 [Prunus dulcis]